MSPYICKECGMAVLVFPDGRKVWACPHEGGTVLAQMDAVVSSDGGVSIELPPVPTE